MSLLAVAVGGLGVVDPDTPVLCADDEALLRGRAAFETMRVYGGVPFRLDEHLARLSASAERIGLPQVDRSGLAELARLALERAGVPDATLRVYWTAGREGSGRPTSAALVGTIPADLDERRAKGARLISLTLGIDTRLRQQSPWLLAGVKSTSYAVNMAAEAEARRRGADDAVFVSGDGLVLEGPVTNVWWRYGTRLETPSLDLGILAGVTRAEVIRQADALGYQVAEGAYPLARLTGAEEAFTSSSVREIMPVVALDETSYDDGRPGIAARAFQEAIRRAAGPR